MCTGGRFTLSLCMVHICYFWVDLGAPFPAKSVPDIYTLILSFRSARSPLKLVDRFPDHPELGTLHDIFV